MSGSGSCGLGGLDGQRVPGKPDKRGKSLASRLSASVLSCSKPNQAKIDVVITPPVSAPPSQATASSFFGEDIVQATVEGLENPDKERKKSRFGVLSRSFRIIRSGWTRKKTQNRNKRSKSVGADVSRGEEPSASDISIKCVSDGSADRIHRSDDSSRGEDKVYPTPEEVSATEDSGSFKTSRRDFLAKFKRKRSKSLEDPSLLKQLSSLKTRAARKRSRSLTSTVSKQERSNLNLLEVSSALNEESSSTAPLLLSSPEDKKSEIVIFLTPDYAYGDLKGTRRRSRSVNDISLIEEDFLYRSRGKEIARQGSTKQKGSSFLRRTLTRLSKRNRNKKSTFPSADNSSSSHSAFGFSSKTRSGEFSPTRLKNLGDSSSKMGQNLSANSAALPLTSQHSSSSEKDSGAGGGGRHDSANYSGGSGGCPGEVYGSKKSKDDREEISKLREELLLTKKQLYEKEQQLFKQHREIHKLKSVLDQQQRKLAQQASAVQAVAGPQKSISHSAAPIKKCGVSGQSLTAATTINKIDKDFRSKQLIKEALLDNSFLQNFLDSHQLRLIIDAMFEKEFAKGTLLCEQGTIGSHLFVIAYGHCQIITNGEPVNSIGPGKAFGELAILYNCSRTASVKALTKVRVWVLDRRIFQAIMMKTGKDKRHQYKTFLKSVPLLQNLSDEMIAKIVDSIEVDIFPVGDYICRQGCHGDSFYIISNGSVRVSQEVRKENSDETEDKLIRVLNKGDYFGEQALLTGGSLRTANVVSSDCECLILDRSSFHSLIGDLNELKDKQYNNDAAVSSVKPSVYEAVAEDNGMSDIKLDDLDVVATLGIGGFGRVDLVRCMWDESRVYALKSCSKAFIRSTQQEQHINNERLVQKHACRHQFVTKLYRTFKDNNFVYFLMEAAIGGELWTLLRNRGAFDEMTSRFFIGGVIEALQYLHSQRIVYRDLKPENCLLDASGYLKLTDFGFSKILRPGEKTWTFCGTPEYVAPEIILNRGHDQAVDFWSIGILLYELLTGLPPFQSTDPLKTYNIILRGFDAIGFDERVFSKHAVNLIRRLCRENPSERIGVQKNGYLDLKRHKWFSGFDWNALVKRTLKPPIVPKLSGPTDTHYFDISPQDMSMRTDFDQENSDDELDPQVDPDWDRDF